MRVESQSSNRYVPTESACASSYTTLWTGRVLIVSFKQNMDQFQDFEKYMTGVNPYGMKSGIVLIDPPAEWYVISRAICQEAHC